MNLEQEFVFELQLFATEPIDGAEEDDVEDPTFDGGDDDDNPGGDVDEASEEYLAGLLQELGIDPETDPDVEDPDSEDEGDEEEGAVDLDADTRAAIIVEELGERDAYVQAKIDELLPKRATQAIRNHPDLAALEQIAILTGMDAKALLQDQFNRAVEAKAEKLGISVEEAVQIVNDEFTARKSTAKQRTAEVEQVITNKQTQYEKEKAEYMKKPKTALFVKEFGKEIDELSQNGTMLSFELALNQVVGKHITAGDLGEKIKQGATQKTLKNVNKRSKAKPLSGTQKGGAKVSLDSFEEQLADGLGLTKKEMAESKKETKRARRGR